MCLDVLRKCGRGTRRRVSEELKKDLFWWEKFLPTYNSVSILWMEQWPEPNVLLACDASLVGAGAVCGQQYTRKKFPGWLRVRTGNIAHLEAFALVASLKLWTPQLRGKRFTCLCDNQAVVAVVNTGAARDGLLQQLVREVAFVAATGQFEVRLQYIASASNTLPDLLSRWGEGEQIHSRFAACIAGQSMQRICMPASLFDFIPNW